MGRLIDSDVLKQELYQQWFMDILLTQKRSDDMFYALSQKIDEIPTAYDPDKVVEQLEEIEEIMTSGVEQDCFGEECKASDCTVCLISRAIEIVKGGGVEQESECEWKLEDSESNLYVTECVNRHLIFEGTPEENGYKYCPYCGRKIKRGGVDGN